ncbi:enolase [Olea europaea subsp. europaea]|uniref:phosphopyruvate hydratase n=1 Tax=Olea europaea subsp. europaea TaxID=158383 RepID=A0A8S0Q0M2_OLEEU|nr:enolase [Olea europaea subsp. europaea]
MVQQPDGTQNKWGWCKQKPGANAILAVSLYVCKVGAAVLNIPLYKVQHIANLADNKKLVLPVPALNVTNGRSHAGNKLAMQEFMIPPVGASSVKEAMKMGVEVYDNLKVVIRMDDVASELYGSDKTYDLNFKENNNNSSQKILGDQLKDRYKSFVSDYPMVSIEGPFDQNDWEHYAKLTDEIGAQVQIVGDGLLVTNPKRVEKAIKEKTCNALLFKEFVGQIKTGAPCRSERLTKYNQLLRIEEELGSKALYAGAKFCVPVEPYWIQMSCELKMRIC